MGFFFLPNFFTVYIILLRQKHYYGENIKLYISFLCFADFYGYDPIVFYASIRSQTMLDPAYFMAAILHANSPYVYIYRLSRKRLPRITRHANAGTNPQPNPFAPAKLMTRPESGETCAGVPFRSLNRESPSGRGTASPGGRRFFCALSRTRNSTRSPSNGEGTFGRKPP